MAAILLPLFSATALAQTPPPAGPPEEEGAVSLDLDIIAKQLDVARGQIQPSLGASVYEFRRDTYYRGATSLIDEGQFGAPINRGAELTLSHEKDNWSIYGNFAAAKALGKKIISSQFHFSPDHLAFIADPYIHRS
jgi:hypothetical protein